MFKIGVAEFKLTCSQSTLLIHHISHSSTVLAETPIVGAFGVSLYLLVVHLDATKKCIKMLCAHMLVGHVSTFLSSLPQDIYRTKHCYLGRQCIDATHSNQPKPVPPR